MKKAVTLLALALSISLFAEDKVTASRIVNDDVTIDDFKVYNGYIKSGKNTVLNSEYTFILGANNIINLNKDDAVNGVYTIYAGILATNGAFTVNAEGIDIIRWMGSVDCPAGSISVKGAKKVVFGDSHIGNENTTTSFSFFKADISFESIEAEGVVFTNGFTCAKLPLSSEWSIAPNARICVDADGVLSSDDVFNLSSYHMNLIASKGVAANEIRVAKDLNLVYRQCSRTKMNAKSFRWQWGGTSDQHFTNDVELVDSTSALVIIGAQGYPHIDGKVTGEGKIKIFTSASSKNVVCFHNGVDVGNVEIGDVTLEKNIAVQFDGANIISLGDVTANVKENSGAVCSITNISSQTIEIDTLSGRLDVSGDSSGNLVIGKILSGGKLNVDGSVKINIIEADPNAEIVFRKPGADGWYLAGGVENVTVLTNNLSFLTQGTLSVGGKLLLGDIDEQITAITLNDGSELYSEMRADIAVSGIGGRWLTNWAISDDGVVASKSWREKIALWADSSKPNAFSFASNDFTYVNEDYNGYAFISQWNDWRDDATHCFRQVRYSTTGDKDNADISKNVFPLLDHVLTLNGQPTVSMWHNGESSGRRINIARYDNINKHALINTAYAIMVFGAQSGGGSALLGTTDGYFAREKLCDKLNEGKGSDRSITTQNVVKVHINGGPEVLSTETGLSNGWQIVSMEGHGRSVNGLGDAILRAGYGGSAQADYFCGFQRYAEVMLFSEMPTDYERKFAEEYLAAKWNLPCAHENTCIPVELSLKAGDAPSEIPIVSLENDDIPRAVTVNLTFPKHFPERGRYALIGGFIVSSYAFGESSQLEGVTLTYDEKTKILYAEVLGRGSKIIIR